MLILVFTFLKLNHIKSITNDMHKYHTATKVHGIESLNLIIIVILSIRQRNS